VRGLSRWPGLTMRPLELAVRVGLVSPPVPRSAFPATNHTVAVADRAFPNDCGAICIEPCVHGADATRSPWAATPGLVRPLLRPVLVGAHPGDDRTEEKPDVEGRAGDVLCNTVVQVKVVLHVGHVSRSLRSYLLSLSLAQRRA